MNYVDKIHGPLKGLYKLKGNKIGEKIISNGKKNRNMKQIIKKVHEGKCWIIEYLDSRTYGPGLFICDRFGRILNWSKKVSNLDLDKWYFNKSTNTYEKDNNNIIIECIC